MWYLIVAALGFAGGYAACWYSKDPIKIWVMGVATFIAQIEDKINKLRG